MSNQPSAPEADLFVWPGGKPIQRTVKQFTCDALAKVVNSHKFLSDFSDNPTRNDYKLPLENGAVALVNWRLQRIVKTTSGEKSPRIVSITFQPESRHLHFAARLEFRPYLDLMTDIQRNCLSCQPARFIIQGGSGDMEACYRWLMMWKLYC